MKFVDINAQFKQLEPEIRAAIDRVLEHGQFIMGPEVAELEQALSDYAGVEHTIACSSGTDALLMALMAWGIKPGDAVFTTPFTFVATAEVVQLLGATPVFVDVDATTFNIDPVQLEQTIATVKAQGELKPRAIIPVDLFGLPADYYAIEDLAEQNQLKVLADGCQSFGGEYKERRVGNLGDATATSFFPAKPLGAYGDGGAVFTDDDELAAVLRSIRIHGMGRHQYENIRTGITGRLDSLQAAILSCKLKVFEQELSARQRIADAYTAALADYLQTPRIMPGYHSAWAQYTVQCDCRDQIRAQLQAKDIPTAVYYPVPLHRQPAFSKMQQTIPPMPVSDALAARVFSLPMHPYLTQKDQERVIESILESCSYG